MKTLETPAIRVMLYEGDGAAPLAAGDRYELVRELLDVGYTLCGLGGDDADTLDAEGGEVVVILGRFAAETKPRLLGLPNGARVLTCNATGLAPAAAIGQIDALLSGAGVERNRPGKWKPWFPVIDYSRCTNCMQCLSFCLFDVYGTSKDGMIQVQNNDNCKTDCPACSRVCPEVAILFPKYAQGPINGDVVRESDVRREAMKVDISALLGGDIYSQLRNRHAAAKERFSKERDEKRALSERIRCLKKLQGDIEIPMEVLTSLPSPEEIRRKAEAASLRAKEALEVAAGRNGSNSAARAEEAGGESVGRA